jgi:hypothetical protein
MWGATSSEGNRLRASRVLVDICAVLCSVGVLLVLMCVPELRSSAAQRGFNYELAAFNYDLGAWRCEVDLYY